MITRRADERPETFEQMRARFDEQCRLCREEQNRLNAMAGQLVRQADANARAVLARLRRRPNEIDPEGRL